MLFNDWLELSIDERIETLNKLAYCSDSLLFHEVSMKFDDWCEEEPTISEWIMGQNHGFIDFRIYCSPENQPKAPKEFLGIPLNLYDIEDFPVESTETNEHGCCIILVCAAILTAFCIWLLLHLVF